MKHKIIMNKRWNGNGVLSLVLYGSLMCYLIFISNNRNTVFDDIIILICLIISLMSIRSIIRLALFPRAKALEFKEKTLTVYDYKKETKESYIKDKIKITDINYYELYPVGGSSRYPDIYRLKIYTKEKEISLDGLYNNSFGGYDSNMNYPVFSIKRILDKRLKAVDHYKDMLPSKSQYHYSKHKFIKYIQNETTKNPIIVMCVGDHWSKRYKQRFFAFKFKNSLLDKKYMLGINGGSIDSKIREGNFSITKFGAYNQKTLVKDIKYLMEYYYDENDNS